MAASRNDITRWFQHGRVEKYTHMLVICDTFEYEDFPSYIIATPEEAREAKEYEDGRNMQKVMEVYDLCLPLDEQINKFRCFNY